MKNSNETIGNRTRDLPTCSAVPQPTAPPRWELGRDVFGNTKVKVQLVMNFYARNVVRMCFSKVLSLFKGISWSTEHRTRLLCLQRRTAEFRLFISIGNFIFLTREYKVLSALCALLSSSSQLSEGARPGLKGKINRLFFKPEPCDIISGSAACYSDSLQTQI